MSERLTADVVVVGSGAGGSAVAGALARAGRTVVMLEAGAARPGRFGDHVRNADPSEAGLAAFGRAMDHHLVYPAGAEAPIPGLPGHKVGHLDGGMFALWTHNCPTPHAAELPSWSDPDDWALYLDRARALLGVSSDLCRGGVRMERLLARVRDAVGPMADGRGVQPMPIAARRVGNRLRFSSAGDLLGEAAASDRLTILAGHVARAVMARGDRATGVDAVNRSTAASVTVSAGTVVVAAGTVGSAKLLAASPIDAGPALGRGLFDHPAFASRVVLKPEILDGVPADDPFLAIWVPFSPEHPWHNQLCRFPMDPTPVVPATGPMETMDVFTWVAMDIDPDNRLTFHPERPDPFGLPSVSARFALSAADEARAARGLGEHFRIASAIGDLSLGWHPAMLKAGESTHLMGSCRMGPAADGSSVTDFAGRVWSTANLYVAGNAVMAQSNAGNPTLTTIAAALRTADAILGA